MDMLGLEIGNIILSMLSIAIGGFLRGFLGFGAALVIVPALSIVLPPVTAIAVLVIIEIPTILYLVPTNFRDASRATLVPIMIGLIIAVPIGTALLVAIDPSRMKLAISVVLLLTVGLLASGWRIKGKIGNGVLASSGLIGGFIQGAAGMGGPPLVTALMSLPDNAQVARANIIMALSTMSLTNFFFLVFYGKVSVDVLSFGLFGAPVYVFANWVGARFFKQHGNRHFRHAALFALATIAVLTIHSNLPV